MSSNIHVICASEIYTANPNSPSAECFAYSTAKRIFTAVGSKETVVQKYKNPTIRELGKNLTVLPGLYDSHGHIVHVMASLTTMLILVRGDD